MTGPILPNPEERPGHEVAITASPRSMGVVILATLALLLKLLLRKPMRFLTRRLRLPDSLAALLVLLALFGLVALVSLTVSVPASGWISRAPEGLVLLREKLAVLRHPIEAFQHVLHGLENVTSP